MEYNEVVTTKDSETIDAFSSRIIHMRVKTAFTGARLNVMTEALHAEEGPLPQGLTIQNAYTDMCLHSATETDCRAKAREAVQKVRLESIGILATRAGRFHLISSG